ncbi:MAG: pseudouridine synthase, partial [Bacteroidetes bacterium]|nr:pseudouridine synthase [Bacteroidota bacterium]
MYKYYKFYKPFGVLSQFTEEVKGQRTLRDYLKIEKDVYPLGRLDKDSEGLLLLTSERSLT